LRHALADDAGESGRNPHIFATLVRLASCFVQGMTHSRHVELKEMLEARGRAIEAQVQQKVRGFRDTTNVDTSRPQADLSDDPAHEDLDFALVQMQSQMLEHVTAALGRLQSGEYGICHECEEEIPEKRLHALPFATRCLPCQASAEQNSLREGRLRQRQPDFRPSV
jgi:DnaK suppressor protein